MDLGSALGLTGFGALLFAAALHLTRSALVKAVEHAGARELQRQKADLDAEADKIKQAFQREIVAQREAFEREIAEKRHAFERELQYARDNAARDLETFKSELTLGAEMRRQVAAKRVEALLQIVGEAGPLLRTLINARRDDPGDRGRVVQMLMANVATVRDRAHLFSADIVDEFDRFRSQLLGATNSFQKTTSMDDLDRAMAAYQKILDVVRRELGVEVPKTNS